MSPASRGFLVVLQWIASSACVNARPFMVTATDAKSVEAARTMCQNMVNDAASKASSSSASGWIMGIAGGTLLIGGAAMGPDVGADVGWVGRNRNLLVSLSGAVFLAASYSLFQKARLASETAGQGELILAGPDAQLVRSCSELNANWLSGHGGVMTPVHSM